MADRARRLASGGQHPEPGSGDNGFFLTAGVGIYAGNDVQRDLVIPTWAFGPTPFGTQGAVIYAPTHLTDLGTASTRACLEATTAHWRYEGQPTTTHIHGFWDFCPTSSGFQIEEDMTDPQWLNKYARVYFGEERFYVTVYPQVIADPEGKCWFGFIYNFNNGGWEVKATSCGTSTEEFDRGWTVWESWYMMSPVVHCPSLPGIKAADIQIRLTSGWVFLENTYTEPLVPNGGCWTGGTYSFHIHTPSPFQYEWHAHTPNAN